MGHRRRRLKPLQKVVRALNAKGFQCMVVPQDPIEGSTCVSLFARHRVYQKAGMGYELDITALAEEGELAMTIHRLVNRAEAALTKAMAQEIEEEKADEPPRDLRGSREGIAGGCKK